MKTKAICYLGKRRQERVQEFDQNPKDNDIENQVEDHRVEIDHHFDDQKHWVGIDRHIADHK